MSPNRVTGSQPARSANAIHVVGHGVVAPVKQDLAVKVGPFEADLIDLTPQDPLSLKAGTYAFVGTVHPNMTGTLTAN